MQPIDPADTRERNVQIAASIRAAILSGEMKPGAQLPTGEELAQFFGVARTTVIAAIRTLREEGFVRSRQGGGTYVRELASLPGPEDGQHALAGTAAFLFEMGHMKELPRAGWHRLGIHQPESVAEHSFRVTMTAIVLAALDGSADPGRTAALAAFHDGHETRVGDVDAIGRAYVITAAPEAVTAHQTSGMPDAVAKVVQDLTAEYEAAETAEARLAHDADKIELLMQAREYAAQGYDTAAWQRNSLAALRTDAGKQLAQAVSLADPHAWWEAFNASYAELRAASRGAGKS